VIEKCTEEFKVIDGDSVTVGKGKDYMGSDTGGTNGERHGYQRSKTKEHRGRQTISEQKTGTEDKTQK